MSTYENENPHDARQSIDALAEEALEIARNELETKKQRTTELLNDGVSAYNNVVDYTDKVKQSQSDLERIVKELEELGVGRSLLTKALGITELSLSRKLPVKRRRATRSRKKSVADSESGISSSVSENHSTSQAISQEENHVQ